MRQLFLLLLLAVIAASARAEPVGPPGNGDPAEMAAGATLYAQHCAQCHDHPAGRTPPRSFIAIIRSPESIINTLTKGPMVPMAKGLSASQIHDVAVFLTGREPGDAPQPDLTANMCADAAGPIDLAAPSWNGWGRDPTNDRFQPKPGFDAADVPRLKLKWAFAYPGIAYGQPTIVGGRIFITTREGQVFALDAKTGCTRWVHDVGAPVRTAVTIGEIAQGKTKIMAAYFGDEKGAAHAVDATTGKPLWTTKLEDHPLARVTGTPALYRGTLYVPMSSMEEVAGAMPQYACCTFQGSVTAVDAATGKIRWKTYTIVGRPKPTHLNAANVQMYAPAGVSVWDSPTIDDKRGVLYVGTGDSYTDAPTDASDAILALDLKTGARKWASQVRPHDDWLLGCPGQTGGNCPKEPGPDFDFGASPVLHALPNGHQIILDGAKSTIVYAFDPDQKGKILWQRTLNEGSATGGILWGPAADDKNYYVSIGDAAAKPPHRPGGVTALDAATGAIVWQTPAPPPVCGWGPENCSAAQPSGVTAMPGVVFAGSWDGQVRGYATSNGAIVWDFDTGQAFDGVNGVKAKGGAIDMGGQTIADGMLVVNSGTTPLQHPGNALLVFTVDGK
jgi:polyvinyl alcohol dehydrogenase (cytochrome)